MKYHTLAAPKKKSRSRKGRGISAGRGKTAGRGTKGQNSRSGGQRRPGFEGGQNPLYMRLPKMPGFTSKRRQAEAVTTDQLQQAFDASTKIDNQLLAQKRLTSGPFVSAKLILGRQPITKKLSVEIQAASAGATQALEAAGGSIKIIPRLMQEQAKEKVAKPAK